MEICGDSLDDLLVELYEQLLGTTDRNVGSRGPTLEMLGTALRLTKPRARLSRSENRGKPFSALGELLWYLAGSNTLEFIRPYVRAYEEDATDGVIHGAYGPRLLAMRGKVDQLSNVARLLTEKPSSRRAVIQLFDAEDLEADHKEIPCTTTLQFHLRNGHLHMSVTMRSNDAYLGLPHDVFCFTMIQEMMARRLGAELGEYYHYAGSMHIYEEHLQEARAYDKEGHHRIVEMPVMPLGNPFPAIRRILDAESRIRAGEAVVADKEVDEPYWADIIRLIQVFWAAGHGDRLDELKAEFVHSMYRSFVEARRGMMQRKPEPRRK